MKTIEEKSKHSQKYHKDDSRRNFNKDNAIPFDDWNYGYCQGYFDAMREAVVSTLFYGSVDKDKVQKASPHLFLAIGGGSDKERCEAINKIKQIINDLKC